MNNFNIIIIMIIIIIITTTTTTTTIIIIIIIIIINCIYRALNPRLPGSEGIIPHFQVFLLFVILIFSHILTPSDL